MKNQLGLKIVRAYQGESVLHQVNANEAWVNKVGEAREWIPYVEDWNKLTQTEMIVLSTIESGQFLTIFSGISGRGKDYITAWIYVPNSIRIMGSQLVDIVSAITKELKTNRVNKENLDKLFSDSYDEVPVNNLNTKPLNNKYGYRYYGKGTIYTLKELLDDRMQSYYNSYKSIFLLDKSQEIKIVNAEDLTEYPLKKQLQIKAPAPVDGFVPYLNGSRLEKSFAVIEGETVILNWEKEGYKTIQKQQTIKSEGIVLEAPQKGEYEKWVSYNAVQVTDNKDWPIQEYTLYINNNIVSKNNSVAIKESNLNAVAVCVEAEGYDAVTATLDLRTPQRVCLRKRTFKYSFELPLTNGHPYTLELTSKEEITEQPIKGYTTKNGSISRYHSNYLTYKPFDKRWWIIGTLAGVIFFLLGMVVGSIFCFSEEEAEVAQVHVPKVAETKEEHITEPNPPIDKPEDESEDIQKAVEYLDSHSKWNKNEMENIAALKGLWDALNGYDFTKVLNSYRKLNGSHKFKSLVEGINTIDPNDINTYLRSNKYNTNNNDKTITPKDYVKKIKETINKRKNNSTSNQGSARNDSSAENNRPRIEDQTM